MLDLYDVRVFSIMQLTLPLFDIASVISNVLLIVVIVSSE